MTHDIALVAFTVLMTLGVVIGAYWLVDVPTPVRRDNPRRIFRLVHREDRAAYARIMRRTLAVQMRDMGRAFTRMGREIGKAMIPALRRVADAARTLLGEAE